MLIQCWSYDSEQNCYSDAKLSIYSDDSSVYLNTKKPWDFICQKNIDIFSAPSNWFSHVNGAIEMFQSFLLAIGIHVTLWWNSFVMINKHVFFLIIPF